MEVTALGLFAAIGLFASKFLLKPSQKPSGFGGHYIEKIRRIIDWIEWGKNEKGLQFEITILVPTSGITGSDHDDHTLDQEEKIWDQNFPGNLVSF